VGAGRTRDKNPERGEKRPKHHDRATEKKKNPMNDLGHSDDNGLRRHQILKKKGGNTPCTTVEKMGGEKKAWGKPGGAFGRKNQKPNQKTKHQTKGTG